MAALQMNCAMRCSIIASEASLLVSMHVARMLSSGKGERLVLDQNLFNRCTSAVANYPKGSTMLARDQGLLASARLYASLYPAHYEPIGRFIDIQLMLIALAQQAYTCFKTSTATNLYARATLDELQSVVDDEFFTDLCEKRVRLMHHFLVEIVLHNEQHPEQQLKTFTLVPQKALRSTFAPLSTSILRNLHKELRRNNERLSEEELWSLYFDVDFKNKTFEHYLATDGIVASWLLSRPPATATSISLLARATTAISEGARVVTVDPGLKPVLTAVVNSESAGAAFSAEGADHPKHEVIKWSSGRFQHESGVNHSNCVMAMWVAKAPAISAFNAEVASPKTTSYSAIVERTRYVLLHLREVMRFFSSTRIKRLKFTRYIKRQQTYERLAKHLKGGNNNTVVVWGDASFSSSGCKCRPVPTTTLRKKIGARVLTLDEDEHNISKMSCCCSTAMVSLPGPRRRSDAQMTYIHAECGTPTSAQPSTSSSSSCYECKVDQGPARSRVQQKQARIPVHAVCSRLHSVRSSYYKIVAACIRARIANSVDFV